MYRCSHIYRYTNGSVYRPFVTLHKGVRYNPQKKILLYPEGIVTLNETASLIIEAVVSPTNTSIDSVVDDVVAKTNTYHLKESVKTDVEELLEEFSKNKWISK